MQEGVVGERVEQLGITLAGTVEIEKREAVEAFRVAPGGLKRGDAKRAAFETLKRVMSRC